MKAALTLFTIIPARAEGKDVEELSHRFYLIVFVGLFYGLIAATIMYVGDEWLSRTITAAIVLAVMHLLNRFLHLDGLSDLGDGMVCGGNAERKMAAMKDSSTGAGGVGYVLVFGLLSFAALSSITGREELLFLPLVAEIMNKNSVVFCAFGGKAREGLGSMFVSNTKAKQAMLSFLLSTLLAFGLVLLFDMPLGIWFWTKILFIALLSAFTSSLVGLYMSRVAERNFGSVNGDVLGATNEISRPIVLVAMLLAVMV